MLPFEFVQHPLLKRNPLLGGGARWGRLRRVRIDPILGRDFALVDMSMSVGIGIERSGRAADRAGVRSRQRAGRWPPARRACSPASPSGSSTSSAVVVATASAESDATLPSGATAASATGWHYRLWAVA